MGLNFYTRPLFSIKPNCDRVFIEKSETNFGFDEKNANNIRLKRFTD